VQAVVHPASTWPQYEAHVPELPPDVPPVLPPVVVVVPPVVPAGGLPPQSPMSPALLVSGVQVTPSAHAGPAPLGLHPRRQTEELGSHTRPAAHKDEAGCAKVWLVEIPGPVQEALAAAEPFTVQKYDSPEEVTYGKHVPVVPSLRLQAVYSEPHMARRQKGFQSGGSMVLQDVVGSGQSAVVVQGVQQIACGAPAGGFVYAQVWSQPHAFASVAVSGQLRSSVA
jgi:hypothetical protein